MLKRTMVAVLLLSAVMEAQFRFRTTTAPPPVNITLVTMTSPWSEDTVYQTQTVTVDGGVGPYTCAVSNGAVPTGLTFSDPTLSGTPTTPGTYNFSITCTDSQGRPDTQAYSITISPLVVGNDFGGYRPHFQGFGATSMGGRGGGSRVCTINTTTVSGTPTWGTSGTRDVEDCMEALPPGCLAFVGTQAACARFVVSEVSGVITVPDGQVSVVGPYLTAAFQTSPANGEGNCTANCNSPGGNTLIARLLVDTHDVVIQHLRISRPPANINGCSVGDASDGGDNSHVYNVIIDHVTCRWAEGVNNYLQAGPGSTSILLTDSMIYEGLWPGALGGIGAGVGGDAIVARNLFAHHYARQPIWGGVTRLGLVNNVAYNGTDNTPAGDTIPAFFGDADADFGAIGTEQTVISNNAAILGPQSTGADGILGLSKKTESIAAGSVIYMVDNTGPGITGATGNGQWTSTVCGNYGAFYTNAATCGTGSNMRTNTVPTWFSALNFQTITNTSNAVRTYVLANAGARPLDRDAADTRIASQVLAGTGTHFLDWTYIQNNYGGQPTLTTRNRPVTLPANPNGQGDCGSNRTILECFLECDTSFGARRLEPAQSLCPLEPPDPPTGGHYLRFFEIRYANTGTPMPVDENGNSRIEFTIDGTWTDALGTRPRYKYTAYTYTHRHVSVSRSGASFESVALSEGELDALFGGQGSIPLSTLQEEDIKKIHAELNDDPPLFYGAQRNSSLHPLYDQDGYVIQDTTAQNYRDGKTITWPADFVYQEGRLYWNLTTPAVMEYLVRLSLKHQTLSPDARIFIDESGTYWDDLFILGVVSSGNSTAQMDHVAARLNFLNNEIRTRVDPLGRINAGLMPNSGFRFQQSSSPFFLRWIETLKTTASSTIDSMMIENVWMEPGWANNVQFYRDNLVALNALGKKVCFVATNYPFLNSASDPHVMKLWLWVHLIAQAPGTYLSMNPNNETFNIDYDVYDFPLGSPLEDPYKVGSVWHRRYQVGEIIFDESIGSIDNIHLVPN